MPNPFCHMDLATPDAEGARAFYAALFDWKFSTVPGPVPYTLIDTGREPGGGLMAAPPGVPTAWTPYVLVDDVAASAKKVTGLGGKVLKEKTAIPGFGWFAVAADPQGAAIGLFQKAGP